MCAQRERWTRCERGNRVAAQRVRHKILRANSGVSVPSKLHIGNGRASRYGFHTKVRCRTRSDANNGAVEQIGLDDCCPTSDQS
jgi:hypothetical protein